MGRQSLICISVFNILIVNIKKYIYMMKSCLLDEVFSPCISIQLLIAPA